MQSIGWICPAGRLYETNGEESLVMKRIASFTLLALATSGWLVANSENGTPTNFTQFENSNSWERLQTTLENLSSTRGNEAPSLGLALIVNEDLFRVDLKPNELLNLMQTLTAAANGELERDSAEANRDTLAHLVPSAAMMQTFHEVAAQSPAVTTNEWSEELSSNTAYTMLSQLVMERVRESSNSDSPYVPSLLVSANEQMNERGRSVEDSFFERWNSNEAVQEELMSADTASQLLRSLGRYPRGNREIFNLFLTAVSEREAEAVWSTFDSIHSERARTEAEAARDELVRSSYLALEKARQTSARPQNLFVEVFSNENSRHNRVKVNEPVGIHYSYNIGENVPHTLWLSIRDKDDTIIYEKTLSDLQFDQGHQNAKVTLPGLSFSGTFQAVLTIRNEQGHFSDIADSFRVVNNLATADQERYDALEDLFGAASQKAHDLVARLQELADQYDAVHPELLSAAGAIRETTEEITADNLTNTPEENIAKWLQSGHYDAYNKEVEAYNEDVETSDELLAEGKTVRKQLNNIEALTKPLAEALDNEDLDSAVKVALSSEVTSELGFTETITTAAGVETTTVEESVSQVQEEVVTEEIAEVESAEEQTEATAETDSESETVNVQESFSNAVLNNDIESAQVALNNGANVNASEEGNSHILHRLIESDNVSLATIEFLVNSGADIHVANREGVTPMMAFALSTNNSEEREAILRYYIEKGVHFNSLALKRVKNKGERLDTLRTEKENLEANNNKKPYLYDEAISLFEEATVVEATR